MLDRKISHGSKFTFPERKQLKRGSGEGGEEGTELLPLPLGLLSRGRGGIEHIPSNSIRETSIKAATLMCRNTGCVRTSRCPLIKGSQLAAASRRSRSVSRGWLLSLRGGGGRVGSFQGSKTALDSSLLTSLVDLFSLRLFPTASLPSALSYLAVPVPGTRLGSFKELLTGSRGFGLAN